MSNENIDIKHILTSSTEPSGIVYVIVDQSNNTRTCIATPPKDMNTKDAINIINNSNNTIYNNIDLIHLDSRHTEAAYILTYYALDSSENQHPPLITIDVEKDRPPYLSYILPLCDIIFTNETFTETYSYTSNNTTSQIKGNNTDLSLKEYTLLPVPGVDYSNSSCSSDDKVDLNKL